MNDMLIISLIAVLAIFVIVSIVIGVINISKINSILDYAEDGDLVGNLEKYYNNIRDIQRRVALSDAGKINDRIAACDNRVNLSLSKTGIVNFDAFDGVYGKQSFALAILNQHNTGFCITSLYGSNSSNTYVRRITEGKCDIELLEEEKEAVMAAITGHLRSEDIDE